MPNTPDNIVFYDGVCGLCDRLVQFLIKQDKKQKLHFCALQSETAVKLLGTTRTQNLNSLYFLKNAKIYSKSSGALQIAFTLGFPWILLSIFLIVPAFIRNWIYDIVASNRYQRFGKYDSCKIPNEKEKERFVS